MDIHVLSMYQHAMTTYRQSRDVVTMEQLRQKKERRREAMRLLAEVMVALRTGEEEGEKKLYVKACYRFCRCVIEEFHDIGPLKEEIDLLFPKAIVFVSPEKRRLFIEACQAIEAVRVYNQLPRQVAEMDSLPRGGTYTHEPLYIYYTLGQILDIAGQYRLCQRPSLAFQSARRYYTYACQYDQERSANGHVPFRHGAMALGTLCTRLRQYEEAERILATYREGLQLPTGYSLLQRVRLAIGNGEFGEARAILVPYLFKAQWQPGFPKQRAMALALLVDIAVKRKYPSTAGTAWQRKELTYVAQCVEGWQKR